MGSDTRELFLICTKVYLFNFVENAVSESWFFSIKFKCLCLVMSLPILRSTLFLQSTKALPQVLPGGAPEIRNLKRMAASSQAVHAGCELKSFLSEGFVG